MFTNEQIKILLIEDEDFDVRRIKNTLDPFSDRIKIAEIVSNGKEALDLLKPKKGAHDLVIMDRYCKEKKSKLD